MLRYSNVESWFLNFDSRARSKKNVRSVRHRMHIWEVEYKDI